MRTSSLIISAAALAAIMFVAGGWATEEKAVGASQDGRFPPGVLGRVDGVDVTVEQYQQFLYRKHNLTRLMEFIDELLIEKKAKDLGIELGTDELVEMVDLQIQGHIEQLFQGDRDRFIESLKRRTQTFESYRRWQMDLTRIKVLRDRCTRKLRKVIDSDIEEKFRQTYGPDGVHIQVRHILIQRTTKGSDGSDRDPEALAQRIVDELSQDPDQFVELVQKYSEDSMTKRNDGFIPNYKPTLFGAGFHAALESLERDGQIAGPVSSDRGIHVLQRVKRTVTKLEDVRDEIRSVLERNDPSAREKARFLKKLREDANIEL